MFFSGKAYGALKSFGKSPLRWSRKCTLDWENSSTARADDQLKPEATNRARADSYALQGMLLPIQKGAQWKLVAF